MRFLSLIGSLSGLAGFRSCCLVCGALAALPAVGAAEVGLNLRDGLADPAIIAVNAGDTVTWTLAAGQSGAVEAFGGAWKSPVLTNTGASFSHTFTNAGFFAYRTLTGLGTIDVLGWTNSPPPIMITAPVDGFYLPSFVNWSPLLSNIIVYLPDGGVTNAGALNPPNLYPIVASVSSASGGVERVEFFEGTNSLGTLTNAPYRLLWTNPAPGAYALSARLTDKHGVSSVSRTIGVTVGSANFYQPHRLVDGKFLCYFSSMDHYVLPHRSWRISYSDTLSAQARTGAGDLPGGYGIWLDASATNSAQRFYFLDFVVDPLPW